MASSGWQGERTLYGWGSYSSLAFNLRVDSISHSGNTVYVSGVLRFIYHNSAGGTGYYNYTMSATPSGSGTVSYGTWSNQRDGYYQDRSFSGSFSASSGATSGTFYVPWSSTSGNSGTASWGLSFSQSGSAPSGGSITNINPQWDRVTATIGGVDWGGSSPKVLELKILKSAYVPNTPARQNTYYNNAGPVTTTVTNQSSTLANPTWYIKGCGFFYTGLYAENTINVLRYQGPTFYTPPAPSQFTYTDPGTPGTKNFAVTFTGSTENTDPNYDSSQLTRTVRYKIDNGNWVYLDNATQAAVDFVSNYTIPVPAGSVATVEGWMNYRTSLQSEVSTFTLANTNAPVHLYGSVNAQSEEIAHLYGSVRGRSKKIKKLYASVGGVAKKVFEDV